MFFDDWDEWCDLSHKSSKIKANNNQTSNELGLVPNCFLKLREKWLSDEKPVMSEISDKV